MKLLILLALVLAASAYKPARCPPDQIQSQRGCLKDCASPQFHKCPDVFTLQFEPNFCALGKDGSWSEHTFQCQACQIDSIVGVMRGPCSDPTQDVDVKPLPSPIPDWTATTPLPNNRGLPFPRAINPIGVIREPVQVQGLNCPNIRPNQVSCPTLNYLVAPQLNFCGVNTRGERRGFDLACSACKDKTVRFYYNCPCSRIGLDIDRPLPVPVRPPVVQQRTCNNSKECQQWQFCLENKCADRCATMRCAGGCVRDQCQPIRRTEWNQVQPHTHY